MKYQTRYNVTNESESEIESNALTFDIKTVSIYDDKQEG